MTIQRRKIQGKRTQYKMCNGEWLTLSEMDKRGLLVVNIKTVSARLTMHFKRDTGTTQFQTIEDIISTPKTKIWSRKPVYQHDESEDIFTMVHRLMPGRS